MEWNATGMMVGVVPGDRVGAVHGPMNMPWMSINRINKYVTNFDFTNSHDVDANGDNGVIYFDLMYCQFVTIDYTHGKHGHFGIAKTFNRGYDVFHISLITMRAGIILKNSTRIIQSEWRKKRANKHYTNTTLPLCLAICRMAINSY